MKEKSTAKSAFCYGKWLWRRVLVSIVNLRELKLSTLRDIQYNGKAEEEYDE